MNFVIGSGPAGISAARALIDRGQLVTMLDAGIELESDTKTVLDHMRHQSPQEWDRNHIDKIKTGTDADIGGIPVKHVYGSLFFHKGVEENIFSSPTHISFLSSFAAGGLSNVWGGAVLPFSDHDIHDWPIDTASLAPHYARVLDFIPFAAREDFLSTHFPLYKESTGTLEFSQQAKHVLNHLENNRKALEENGIWFGASRLSVSRQDEGMQVGCRYCGLCLYGCPYGCIYSTTITLNKLKVHPNFTYINNERVERISESNGHVEIESTHITDGKKHKHMAHRVFLGAGVLNTAKIILNSLNDTKTNIPIATSQHFIIPLLTLKSVPEVASEKLHTLAHLFIEVLEHKNPKANVHMQLYTYNDLFEKVINKSIGGVWEWLSGSLKSRFLSRLLILQGYLHSDISPRIWISIDPDTKKLHTSIKVNPDAKKRMKEVAWRFLRNYKHLGAVALAPFSRISSGGIGAHIGGSFPMRSSPTELTCDVQGRLHGFRSIYIVDASVFPTVPPSTITLTIMANAHRIASQSVEEI